MNKEEKVIDKLVDQTIKLEDAGDDSMFAFFANDFVEKYATKRSSDVINFFDNIMNKQKDKVGSYGDADVTITKLDVKNLPKERKFISTDTQITYQAIQLIVECNDYAFFVISKLEDTTYSKSRILSVYYCHQKRVNSIDLKKVIDDPRMENFCFKVKIHFYGEEDALIEAIRFYDFPRNDFYHFKQVYKELRSISNNGFEEDEM